MLPLLLLLALAQQPVPSTVSAIFWEYPDTLAVEAVFVLKVDAGPPVQLTPTQSLTTRSVDAPPNTSTYRFVLPALTITTHNVTIQACNKDAPSICGPASDVPFRLVVAPVEVVTPRVR